MLDDDTSDAVKNVIDTAALLTVIGTLTDLIPAIAALFTVIWTAIRIYESDTYQRVFGGKKDDA